MFVTQSIRFLVQLGTGEMMEYGETKSSAHVVPEDIGNKGYCESDDSVINEDLAINWAKLDPISFILHV